MKTIYAFSIFASAIAITSAPAFASMADASEGTNAPSCADVCGYAVVGEDGTVHGVIVCQEGCFGGTMPGEYMGCPPGCALVLQSPADRNGNVAGVNGPNVHYDSNTNTFERVGENGEPNWSHVGGQPLDWGAVSNPAPPSTIAPPPVNDSDPAPTPDNQDTPATTTPAPDNSTTPAPESDVDDETPAEIADIVSFIMTTNPNNWPLEKDVPTETIERIQRHAEFLQALVYRIWGIILTAQPNATN